jgi:hypothetical protein
MASCPGMIRQKLAFLRSGWPFGKLDGVQKFTAHDVKIAAMLGTPHNSARLPFLIQASRSQGPSLPCRMLLFGRGN